MSGAEAIVAFGIATNVVQFIDFTVKLCSRIRAYASGSGLPKKLAAQADRLSDLTNVLETLSKSSNQEVLSGQSLARCQTQAQALSDFLDDLKSDGQKQNWAKNAGKAFKSLKRSDQIEELQGVLDSLVGTLSLQLQADTRYCFTPEIRYCLLQKLNVAVVVPTNSSKIHIKPSASKYRVNP